MSSYFTPHVHFTKAEIPNIMLYTVDNHIKCHMKTHMKHLQNAPLTSIVGKENTMEVNGSPELLCFPHSSEYLPLCSAEQRHSYRFGTT